MATEIIRVRVTPEQKRFIEMGAALVGESTSTYVRIAGTARTGFDLARLKGPGAEELQEVYALLGEVDREMAKRIWEAMARFVEVFPLGGSGGEEPHRDGL